MGSRLFSRLLGFTGVLVLLLVAVSPVGAKSQSSLERKAAQEKPVGVDWQAEIALGTGEISMIIAGGDHMCALTSAGAVKCWGRNDQRQLGDGSPALYHTIPTAVKDLTSGVQGLAAGNLHTCALTSAGAVYCWGANGDGQLGNGGTARGEVPVGVFGLASGIKAIAAGYNFTCALTTAGGVLCWGDNSLGQLGNDSTPDPKKPSAVSGLGSNVITAIAAGGTHACALTSTGGVKCWGGNDSGQLGDNSTDPSDVPVDVIGLGGIVAIAAGGSHTCAINGSGGVVCWGSNENGQLGDGTNDPHWTPADVSGLTGGITAVTAGGSHTCALLDPSSGPLGDRGKVKCWGYNSYGQLGIGTRDESSLPLDVVDLSGMIAITAGWSSTCALTGDSLINCWGRNTYGQLGDATTIDRLTPVLASNPKIFLAMINRK